MELDMLKMDRGVGCQKSSILLTLSRLNESKHKITINNHEKFGLY
jgi:hypothetical protein